MPGLLLTTSITLTDGTSATLEQIAPLVQSGAIMSTLGWTTNNGLVPNRIVGIQACNPQACVTLGIGQSSVTMARDQSVYSLDALTQSLLTTPAASATPGSLFMQFSYQHPNQNKIQSFLSQNQTSSTYLLICESYPTCLLECGLFTNCLTVAPS